MSKTRRQKLDELLRLRPYTALELSALVHARRRDVLEDLEHVLRGLACAERMEIEPALCQGCGFVFRDRARLETPSRCPLCRGESIDPPAFFIASEES